MDLEVRAYYTFLKVTLFGMFYHSDRNKTNHLALGVGPTLTPEWSHLNRLSTLAQPPRPISLQGPVADPGEQGVKIDFSGVNSLTCHLVPSGI